MKKNVGTKINVNDFEFTTALIKPAPKSVPLFREELGRVLRDTRKQSGMTLREVSEKAMVSLGYLSEVERGQKEASSELLASICDAMNVSLSMILREVASNLEAHAISHLDFSLPVQIVK